MHITDALPQGWFKVERRSPDDNHYILDGGDILPEFQLSLSQLFATADRRHSAESPIALIP